MQVPHNTQQREHFENVERQVDLPPVEALSRRPRIVVMVVMPAFPHRNQGESEMIATCVVCVETLRADNMGQGIDTEGGVVHENRAQEETPHEELPARGMQSGMMCRQPRTGGKESNRQAYRGNDVIAVNKAEFGVAAQILNARVIPSEVLAAQ